MRFPRSSGLFLHPTSLPGPFGIGDLGPEALSFVDFLAASGQSLWQVLPLGPTGYGDSPYQSFSALAGNPLLISPQSLAADGWLTPEELQDVPRFPQDEVDFAAVIPWKLRLLTLAAGRFLSQAPAGEREAFDAFCERNAAWLDDYALFLALKETHEFAVWSEWEPELRQRRPEALEEWRSRLETRVAVQKFLQFTFFSQWQTLREYSAVRGVRLMGDLPIYVAHDSADVWANPQFFQLDQSGRPGAISGVPPDYFSATGQLWGTPTYRWDALAEDGYRWWLRRFRAVLELVDVVRMDHFRGFEAYWEVPAGEATAENGQWMKAPGMDLFLTARADLGELPLVAENLGVITPEVEAIREMFGFPGMSVLQFAFGEDPQAPTFRPHNYPRNLVAYTGTHDCDTTVGWWTSEGTVESTRTPEMIAREREYTRRYLQTDGRDIHWVFIRALAASVADTVLVPLQDVMGLGSGSRMNRPATLGGNWRWRFRREMLTPEMGRRLKELTEIYERCPAGCESRRVGNEEAT